MSDDSTTRAARIRQKSATRRERQRAEVRRAILDAAGELFLKHGYERFSLRQVAEEVGYTPTTIYLYFADKDELLFEVALEGFERFEIMLKEANQRAQAPLERLEALGRAYIAFGLAHPVHYRLMFMQRGEFMTRQHPTEQRPLIDSGTFGLLFKAVGEAMAAGALEPGDPLTYASMLWAGVHGIVALAISMPFFGETEAQQMADIYFPMTRRGIAIV